MTIKRCFKCGVEKNLGEFYRHPMMKDGHLNKCKACAIADVDKRYRAIVSTPEGLESERERGREKYHRLYGNGPNWKSPRGSSQEKKRACGILATAVQNKKVLKGTRCEDCGVTGRRLHGHHEDYGKPLAVNWVCSTCHRRRHATHPGRVKSSPGSP